MRVRDHFVVGAFPGRRSTGPRALSWLTMGTAWALAFAGPATAFPAYVDNFPNGTAIDGVGCINCHNSARGGDARNPFGRDLGGSTDWASVCPDDSDGDGLSNGDELGDPDCIWTRGDTPARETDISNPGEGVGGCASTGTGNGAAVALLGLGLLVLRRRRT